jgi:hypothetical protein
LRRESSSLCPLSFAAGFFRHRVLYDAGRGNARLRPDFTGIDKEGHQMKKYPRQCRGIVALAALLALPSANAAVISYVGPFSGDGEISISQGSTVAVCNMHLVGDTSRQTLTVIRHARFSGASELCGKISMNTNAVIYPITPKLIWLQGVVLDTPAGKCTISTTFPATWSNEGSNFSFTDVDSSGSAGNCKVSMSVSIWPEFFIY